MNIHEFRKIIAGKDFQHALDVADNVEVKDRYFFYERAKLHLSVKKYIECIKDIDNVLAVKKDWLGAYAIKITALLNENDEKGLISTFFCLIDVDLDAESKDREKILVDKANEILDSKLLKKFELLNAVLSYELYSKGKTNFYNFFSGIVDVNFELNESAEKKFKQINSFDNLGRHASGALSFRSLSSLDKLVNNLSGFNVKIDFIRKINSSDWDKLIYAACDAIYFKKFAGVFLGSFKKNMGINGKTALHIHVVNPDEECFLLFNNFLEDNYFLNISFEYSYCVDKVYFACSRFLVCENIMNFYDCDLLICDIDSFFVGDFSIKDLLKDNDIIVKKDNNIKLNAYPWRSIAAGFFGVKNNQQARKYMCSLKSYLLNFLVDNLNNNFWYCDQSAIYCLNNIQYKNELFMKIGYIHGETSKIIRFPDASKETKDQFILANSDL